MSYFVIVLIAFMTFALVDGANIDGLCETTVSGMTDDGQIYEEKVFVCCSGYTQDSSGKCLPICDRPCIYGTCIAPNVCVCKDGYQMIKDKCVPICKNKCINGYCSKPGVCGCPKDFEIDDKNATFCIPICKPKCTKFSVCIKSKHPNPNRCECINGYIRNRITKNCEPVCKDKCTNGFCSAPDICDCFEGFELDKNNLTNCLPICVPKCQPHSTCAKPNFCKCIDGYEYNKNSGKCIPVCRDKIKYSKCIEPPNTWECLENYKHDFKIDKCVMESCSCNNNGYCLDHKDDCLCYKGYSKNNETGQCESICKPKCQNSICIEENICECLDGYHKTLVDHICEENNLCFNKPCHNGDCLITGECKCKPGFIKSFSYNGQFLCDKIETFMGKVLTTILGVPLFFALIVFILVYVTSKRKVYKVEEQELRLIHRR